jgi:hypothetical protein
LPPATNCCPFLADYNARFGKEPRNPKNLHRPLSAGDDLTDVFAWREQRTVSNSLTLQYDKVVFLLEPNAITRELRRKRVTVVDYPDGRLAIRYRGLDLPYTTFDKLRQVSQATIIENKHLGAVLSQIRERQLERSEARSQSAPRRQGQVGPHVQSRLNRIPPPQWQAATAPARHPWHAATFLSVRYLDFSIGERQRRE